MARSNSGGTRGWLRGKVANDLYQVSHTKDGRKVQLVRAVEESRVNNNTLEQALARMRMALLMGALQDLKEIVDHSWQGIPYGQLSIANFVRVNMQSVIADCKEHWNTENWYCYPLKGVKQMRVGAFFISSGTLAEPKNISRGVNYLSGVWYPVRVMIGKPNPTFGDLRASLGLNAADYITILMMDGFYSPSWGLIGQGFHFVRVYLAEGVADDVLITPANVSTLFAYDGNTDYRISVSVATGTILIEVATNPDGVYRDCLLSSLIVSRWDGKVWCRNNARFWSDDDTSFPSFESCAPIEVFQSWYPSFDPEGEDSGEYPGK